jgi:autotransporter strand-loop-strand O-heptosyltransferase
MSIPVPIVLEAGQSIDSPVGSSAGPAEPSASGASAGPPADSPRPAYPPPAERPTQQGPKGIRYDFNLGCRVVLPEGDWRICLRDLDTGNILFESENKGAFVNSAKRWFVRFRIEVWDHGESIFRHDYDAEGRDVLIQFPVGTLGDTLGWFPYAVKFQQRHNCRLTCAMSGLLIPLFRDAHPDITFVTHEEVRAEQFYASYCIGLFFDDTDCIWQPTDFRLVGLHRTAGYILGVDPEEVPPRIAFADDGPPIAGPYVCIAVQSSSGCKFWNNPNGWRETVGFLKASGYRVVCIDQKPVHGSGLMWTHIPHGVEDETGDRPLAERARWLKHAAFFVGLSSGLAWLSWAVGTPAVVISGFTHPTNEFATPYRVINWHACNGCWNDPKLRFDHKDFLWCPRHAGTPRQFECTRLIRPAQVQQVIQKIPGFVSRAMPRDTNKRAAD